MRGYVDGRETPHPPNRYAVGPLPLPTVEVFRGQIRRCVNVVAREERGRGLSRVADLR